jgi:hypothetical protein
VLLLLLLYINKSLPSPPITTRSAAASAASERALNPAYKTHMSFSREPPPTKI